MAYIEVVLWVCPTKGCGNYYGTSGTGDLTKLMNHNINQKPTFPRSSCPDCHRFGRGQVERIPITTRVEVPNGREQIPSEVDQKIRQAIS